MLKKTLLIGMSLSWLGAAALLAQANATFVLTNGERHSGPLVYGRESNNIVDMNFHVMENGSDRQFPMDNVAVIDFAGGSASADAASLPNDNNTGVMMMRNGTAVRGHLHNIIGGDQVQWVNESGQRQNYPISEVSRVYLKPQTARSAFLATSGEASPQAPGGMTIRVPANQQWTDTGINVRRGERVLFYATGDIQAGNNISAGVAGSPVLDQSRMPLKSAAGASLIGKVGNSSPFYVGWNPNPISMNANGRLYLGINDDNVNDNSGEFTVVVAPNR